jgi:tetratricopeptide (TPR) repeat protein
MNRTMKATVLAALAAASLCVAGAAVADDGDEGLAALNRGDFATAIPLLTRALKSRDLSDQNREYAYFNRGMAYLYTDRYPQASADLSKALELNPSDSEAQHALERANAGTNGASALAVQWGGLAALAGGYWVKVDMGTDKKGRPKQKAQYYYQFTWDNVGQTLSYKGVDITGADISGTFQRDPTTHLISDVFTFNGNAETVAVEVTLKGYIELGDNGASRTTLNQVDANTFSLLQEKLDNKVWSTTASSQMIQSQQLAQSMAVTAKAKAAGRTLKKCAGEGLKAGLLNGLLGAGSAPAQSQECGGPAPADGN